MPAQKALIFDELEGLARCQFPDFLDLEHLNIGPIGLVTVDNETITPIKTHTGVIAGSGFLAEQIRTITGGVEGSILVLRCENARVMNKKGNLRLISNFKMNNWADTLILLKAQDGNWLELARSNNS